MRRSNLRRDTGWEVCTECVCVYVRARVCVCLPLSGASSQDELQSFGLESNMMYGGHLSALQAAVQKLQLVGFLQDLQTQSHTSHDLTVAVTVCVFVCVCETC